MKTQEMERDGSGEIFADTARMHSILNLQAERATIC